MKKSSFLYGVNKNILFLSLGFALIFAAFNGVQQYIAVYFKELGFVDVGINSLILIYTGFVIFNPFVPYIIRKISLKYCMIIATIAYSLFIFALPIGNKILIYFTSLLLGFSACGLWVAESSYLIRATNSETSSSASGFFYSINLLGSTLGIFFLGYLLKYFDIKSMFFMYLFLPLVAIFPLFMLKDIRNKPLENLKIDAANRHGLDSSLKADIKNVLRCFVSFRNIQSVIPRVYFFVYGLIISVIPIEIEEAFERGYVGMLTSIIFGGPIVFSYLIGRIGDKVDKRKMFAIGFIFCLCGLLSFWTNDTQIFIIIGLLFLSLAHSLMLPILPAFIGMIAEDKNIEYLSSFSTAVQNISIVIALFISKSFDMHTVYGIAFIVVLICIVLFIPVIFRDKNVLKKENNLVFKD